MLNSQVVAELFRVTGALDPVSPATTEDLRALRERLAHSLFDLPDPGVPAFIPADPAVQPVLAEIQALVSDVEARRTMPGASPPRSRVLRRELPIRSANLPAPFPGRSGGQMVARSFGPMLEDRERFVFFDLIEAAAFRRVARQGQAPWALIPSGAASPDGRSFVFGRGSVWIRADQLAPLGIGYVGLRVASGTLVVDAPVVAAGQMLTVSAQAVCVLTLVLDPPVVDTPAAGLGRDAAAAATRPAEARFTIGPEGVRAVDCGDASVTAYGVTVALRRNGDAPVASPSTGGVLIPFDPSLREVVPQDVRSDLFRPAGQWRIGAAGWLLPGSLTADPDELGEAADAGALALEIEGGMNAVWRHLAGGAYVAAHASILVDSHELAVIAEGRTPRIARSNLHLWRASSLELLFQERFRLFFLSSRSGAEALGTTATAVAHLDRPTQADGQRQDLRFPGAGVFLVHHGNGDETVHLAAARQVDPAETVPLALSNALLHAMPAATLTLFGLIVDGGQVAGAALRLVHGLRSVTPFLPDPYAANFVPSREARLRRPRVELNATITWSGPDHPVLTLSMRPLDADAANLPRAVLPGGSELSAHADGDDLSLELLFNRTVSTKAEPAPPLVLLDLSSNASQFGVATAFSHARNLQPPLTVEGVSLSASANNLRVLALPQIQWEPVRTHPQALRPNFPQPLVSRDDGGPFVMGVETDSVHLVPIAPEPVLQGLVGIAEAEDSSFAIRFTLPFGIKAVTAVRHGLTPGADRPSLALNAPEFGRLAGGLQLSVSAAVPQGIPGGAIQTKNSDSTPAESVLDVLDGFFNLAFRPADTNRRVPLSRIDFSGFGASTFSKWVNEQAAAVDITKVEFDVMVGRTSYEVVEVQSILWPCMARVVRRITIRREGHGGVLRRDSGWVAATPGLFERPDCACVFHPGAVRGMFEIREIRDTPRRVRLSSNVDLQVVYFDTDVAFEDVVRGHGAEGRGRHGERVGFVPSRRQLGFVQIIDPGSPQQTPLSPAQLKELLENHGPVGGPVDCELDIGRSNQRFRAASLYAAPAPRPGGSDPHFAVATFGAPTLPGEGQWSVVRLRNDPVDSPEPEPVDPRRGIPLIRAGETTLVPADNPNPHRWADPADLFDAARPAIDYALLWATDTFRVLFRRVRIEPGTDRLTSDLAPVLADAYSMLGATGLFPRLKGAIEFPGNDYALRILGPGRLRLEPAPLTHTMPPRVLDVVKAAGVHVFTEYRGGDRHQSGPARIELRFDSSAEPGWSLTIGPVSTVTDIDPFGPLMRLITTLDASSAAPAKGRKPLIEFGGALRPVEELITVLREFGLPEDLLVETPNSSEVERSFKFKAAVRFHLPETHILGKMTGEVHAGMEFGTKRAKHAIVPVPYPPGVTILGPMFDPLGSVELFAEIEGKVQMPILDPLLFGGGLVRLQLTTGYDPSASDPCVREIKLAAAAVGTIGRDLAKTVRVEGEVRYGYVFVADFAKKEYHPGVMIGFGVVLELKVPSVINLVKIAFDAEVVGLVKRVDDEVIQVRAEFTVAGEMEIFDLVDIEYSVEWEWDQKLPTKAIASLAAAIQLGLLPVPLVPP